MKYKVTAVVLVTVLVLAGSIFECVYIRNTFNDFNEKLTALMQYTEYPLDEVQEVGEWWEDKSEILEISVSVLQLNEITVTYGEFEGAVEKGDFDSATALINRIYQYSLRISDMYMLKFNNIL